MTRVNVGIDPRELPVKALLAEHHEMVRIPNKIFDNKYVSWNKIPKEFTLNSGHELFFLNKLGYLKRRYQAVYDTCIGRYYDVESYITAFDGLPEELFKDYTPTERDRLILLERLTIRGHTLLNVSERDITL